MHRSRIELSAPDIGDDERCLVDDVLRSRFLSMGPMVLQFEEAFAARVGTAEAIAVSSGTAGLHLAAIAAGVGPGDVVLTTPFSFIASANVALYTGAIPVFVDIDPVSLSMDAELGVETVAALARGRTPPTQLPRTAEGGRLGAVLPVHVFGSASSPAVATAARQHGVPVIDDACEAVGATLDGIPAGSTGDAGVFAFYPNKQITTGEGGVVVTNDAALAAHVRSLRNHGRGVGDENPELHYRLGFNYRLDEMSAALGLAQLRRLDEILEARRAVAERYELRLAHSPLARPLPPQPANSSKSWFVFIVRLDESVDRAALIDRMSARGIASRVYFHPIHLQPYYRARFRYEPNDFPFAEAAGRSMLALPFHTRLTDDEIDRVCTVLEEEAVRCQRVTQALQERA